MRIRGGQGLNGSLHTQPGRSGKRDSCRRTGNKEKKTDMGKEGERKDGSGKEQEP